MRATVPYIEKKFDEFNRLCFSGNLPRIPVQLSDAKTFLGVCAFRKRRARDGRMQYYDFRLRFNTRIDMTEKEIEDTVIHEMIHYFIGFNQLEDATTHGPVFQKVMNDINRKYHRNITISHKGTALQKEEAIDKRALWHVIAVIGMKDGKTGIKVLPRILQRILMFYNTVKSTPTVARVELYMCNNPFFNKYPNSAALKIYYLEQSEIDKHLRDAERMECDGQSIFRHRAR